MRSSNRCSPTSSTDLWLTCRPGCSQQIVRGRCWRRSPTTCSAPPGLCPGRPTRWPAGPPCVVTWSTSRVGSPDPKANERCIYPFTGPGPGTGICCGTACSTTTPDKSPSDPDHPGPQRPYQETTVDTLGQASSSTTPAPWPTRQRHDQPEARSTSQSVHGFRLSTTKARAHHASSKGEGPHGRISVTPDTQGPRSSRPPSRAHRQTNERRHHPHLPLT